VGAPENPVLEVELRYDRLLVVLVDYPMRVVRPLVDVPLLEDPAAVVDVLTEDEESGVVGQSRDGIRRAES